MNERKILKERRQKRLTAAPLLLRALFKNVSGNEASLRYIKRANEEQLISSKDQSLTYGEVVPSSFLQILGYTTSSIGYNEPSDEFSRIFYDLGCGTGRAVFCAALSPYPFSKVIGIEIIPELCESAIMLKECLHSAISDSYELSSAVTGISAKTTDRNILNEQPKAKQRIAHAMLNEDQLLDRIKEIIVEKNSDGSRCCSQEYLCNELTKRLGHKIYKASLQPFGKFSRFMEKKSDSFSFTSDGSVSILSDSEISLSNLNIENNLSPRDRNETKSIDDDCQTVTLNQNEKLFEEINSISIGSPYDKHSAESKMLCIESKKLALKSVLTTPSSGYLEAIFPLPDIQIIEGDIFEHLWHDDADVVYAASLLFTNCMMEKLTEQVLKMKKGSWMISLKPLKLSLIHEKKILLRDKGFHKMSWQMAEVYIYQIIF